MNKNIVNYVIIAITCLIIGFFGGRYFEKQQKPELGELPMNGTRMNGGMGTGTGTRDPSMRNMTTE